MVDKQHIGGNEDPLLNVCYHGAPRAGRCNPAAPSTGCNGRTVRQTIDISGFLPLVVRQLNFVNEIIIINKRKYKHASELKRTQPHNVLHLIIYYI